MLDEQIALPQPVDITIPTVELFDLLLEAADALGGDAEDIEKLYPERFGIRIFGFGFRPFLGEAEGAIFDFVPGECHSIPWVDCGCCSRRRFYAI